MNMISVMYIYICMYISIYRETGRETHDASVLVHQDDVTSLATDITKAFGVVMIVSFAIF